jgi:hypothetical protein
VRLGYTTTPWDGERRETRIRAAAGGRAAAATGSTVRATNLRPAPPRRRLERCLASWPRAKPITLLSRRDPWRGRPIERAVPHRNVLSSRFLPALSRFF